MSEWEELRNEARPPRVCADAVPWIFMSGGQSQVPCGQCVFTLLMKTELVMCCASGEGD